MLQRRNLALLFWIWVAIGLRGVAFADAPAVLPTAPQSIEAARYLTTLSDPADPKMPLYHLFTGKLCPGCDQEQGIFSAPSTQQPGTKVHAFVFPGKIHDRKNGKLLLDARGFYGRCLKRSEATVYVVFQKEIIDRKNRLRSSVMVAKPGFDHLIEELIEKNLPRVQETLLRVKQKKCFEIQGKNRASLSHPLDVDLRRRASPENDDDDDDDEAKYKNDGDQAP